MISIIVSSRELNRQNPGNLTNLLVSLKNSIYSPKNVEVIFKFDDDDFLIENELYKAASQCPELNIKYFSSERYGYLGLHKAYEEALDLMDPNSYIITVTADDFIFKPNSNWDKEMLDNSSHLKNKPFLVQDMKKLGHMHDSPVFSKKLIDLIGWGDSLSVDGLLVNLVELYLKNNLKKYITHSSEFAMRQMSSFDMSHERWNIEREELMRYLASPKYQDFLKKCEEAIKNYFNIENFKSIIKSYSPGGIGK